MKRSQLNAISRYYTAKRNEEALAYLSGTVGIDYYDFCRKTGYKASASRLMVDLIGKKASAINRLENYKKAL